MNMITVTTDWLLCYYCYCDAQVVVLRKRDFLGLDNPLLAWMIIATIA
jgi:hypothetical protein